MPKYENYEELADIMRGFSPELQEALRENARASAENLAYNVDLPKTLFQLHQALVAAVGIGVAVLIDKGYLQLTEKGMTSLDGEPATLAATQLTLIEGGE